MREIIEKRFEKSKESFIKRGKYAHSSIYDIRFKGKFEAIQ